MKYPRGKAPTKSLYHSFLVLIRCFHGTGQAVGDGGHYRDGGQGTGCTSADARGEL